MVDNRRLFMDVLSNLVAFILFFNMFAFVYVWGFGSVPWVYLIMAVPFFSMLVLRKLVKDVGIFAVVHIVYVVLPFFIFDGLFLVVIATCFAAVAVGHSMASFIKGEWTINGNTALIVMAVLVVSLFAAEMREYAVAGIEGLINASAVMTLGAVVLFVAMDNLNVSLRWFLNRERPEGAAEQGVVEANDGMAVVFMAVVTTLAALSVFFPSGRVVMGILRGIWFVISSVVGLLLRLANLIWGEYYEEGLPPVFEEAPVGVYVGELEPDPAIEEIYFFWNIFAVVAAVVSVFLLIVFVVSIVRALREKKFSAGRETKEELATGDTVSKLKFSLGDLAVFLPRFSMKAKHTVRKAYIKKVNRHIKEGVVVERWHTPEVIADGIRPHEDIDELTQAYEAVRYGKGLKS